MAGASVSAQTRALLAKSAVYQRRNTLTNVCLVVAPVFFCGLMLMLQVLANSILLKQRNNQCGCQCTACCIPYLEQRPWTQQEEARIAAGEKLRPRFTRVERCNPLPSGYCEQVRNATCRGYNDSSCSLRFSSPRQAIFCPIPKPSSWPPVMQTPRLTYRAGGTTQQWMLYTGSNLTAAREVAARMFSAPELPSLQALADVLRVSPLSLLNMRPDKLLAAVIPVLAPSGLVRADGEMLDLAQFSRLGIDWGSAFRSNDYYLDNAFVNTNTNTTQLQLILPANVCAANNLSSVTPRPTPTPLAVMLLSYYNATFPLARSVFQALNYTADKVYDSLGQSTLAAITAACVDAFPREANTTAQLVQRLYCGFGPARCDGTFFIREYGGAWDFKRLAPSALRVDVFYNLSLPASDGPPPLYRISQLVNVAVRGWTQRYWGTSPLVSRVRNRLLGHMSMPKLPTELRLDFSVLLGPLFYTWVVQMLMPSVLQQVVYEKEKRLRLIMQMHGLANTAYWLITYLWNLMLYCLYMVFFVFFGAIIGLKVMTANSLSIQAVFYLIFGLNMLALILVLSSVFTSSRTATVVAFLYVFATGLIGELLLRPLMQQRLGVVFVVQLIPGFALYRGLFELGEYSLRAILGGMPGMRWANLADPGNGMLGAWAILLVEWPLFLALAWYLEQVLGSGTGTRRHPLFFLHWRRRQAQKQQQHAEDASPAASSAGAAAEAPAKPVGGPCVGEPALGAAGPQRDEQAGEAGGEACGSERPSQAGACAGAAASARAVPAAGPGEAPDSPGSRPSTSRAAADVTIVVKPATDDAAPDTPAAVGAIPPTPRGSSEEAPSSSSSSGGGGGGTPGDKRFTFVVDTSDVAAEEARVGAMSAAELAATPIVVRGLRKAFPVDLPRGGGGADGSSDGAAGGRWQQCLQHCFGAVGSRTVVRSLTLAISRSECFGLLGPNGAGKSTTLNMLTGFLEPCAGSAQVEGMSVRTHMHRIYPQMGVCPQDNLLWEQLTGEEHLQFYGRLKGLTGEPLAEAVAAALKSVHLHVGNAGKRRVGAYSGGMKRRLSVAISFIGSPKVVYLDEPSTGLDPASRRALWDVVRRNKAGRAIILTTHSMEEAEVLCDRLGIFVDGRLVCIGAPREITSRYAGYLVFTLTVAHGHEEQAKALVERLSPHARLTYSVGGTFKYELPTSDVGLSNVFSAMAAAKSDMQVLDWSVANATLEQVFIRIAREMKADRLDG